MALTRPKVWNLNTDIEYFTDPMVVLHQGATTPNVDVGFLFNRANGLTSNVALYWSESAQSVVAAFTANSGTSDSNISVASYANVTAGNAYVQALFTTDGLFWSANGYPISTGGGATISGTQGQIQYNNNGTLGATDLYYWSANSSVSFGNAQSLMSSNTISSITNASTLIDFFSATDYRSAKYVISVTDNINNQYQTSEIVLVHDGANSTISSYGIVYTGTSPIATFSSSISANQINLYAQGTSTQNTVKIVRTLIPV